MLKLCRRCVRHAPRMRIRNRIEGGPERAMTGCHQMRWMAGTGLVNINNNMKTHQQIIESILQEGRGGHGTYVVAKEKDHAVVFDVSRPVGPPQRGGSARRPASGRGVLSERRQVGLAERSASATCAPGARWRKRPIRRRSFRLGKGWPGSMANSRLAPGALHP